MNYEDEVKKEDLSMSYELITEVERTFICFVRNFRSQQWLKDMLLCNLQGLVEEMVDMTLDETAFSSAQKLIDLQHLSDKDAFRFYVTARENIRDKMEDEELEDMINHWGDTLENTLNSEIPTLDKTEEHVVE